MTEAKVIAVVLHFRTPHATIECLGSLFKEDVSATVLVDNSEDGGVSLLTVRGEISRLESVGMRVIVLEPGYNLGFAVGVNAGVREALRLGATAVLLLNSDARLRSGALRALTAQIEADGGVAAPQLVGGAGRPVASMWYQTLLGCMVHRWVPGAIAFHSGACMLVSASVAEVEPFDESFFFYGEDVELSARLLRNGHVLRRVPEAQVVHEGAGSARIGSLFYEYHTVRGHWLLARRLPRTVVGRVVACAMRIPVLSVRTVLRSWRNRSPLPLQALWMATIDVLFGRRRSLTPRCRIAAPYQDHPGDDGHGPFGQHEGNR